MVSEPIDCYGRPCSCRLCLDYRKRTTSFRPELGMLYGRSPGMAALEDTRNLTATEIIKRGMELNFPTLDYAEMMEKQITLLKATYALPSFVVRETDYSALVKPKLEDTMSDQTTQPNLVIRTLNQTRASLLSRVADYEVNFKSYIEARDSYEKRIAETAGNLEKTRADLADVEKALVAVGAEKVVTKTVSFT